MNKNQLYKNAALESLKGNWPGVIIITIIMMIIVFIVQLPGLMIVIAPQIVINNQQFFSLTPVVSGLLMLLLYQPLSIGYAASCSRLYEDGDTAIVRNMFSESFGDYFRNMWAMFLIGVATIAGVVLLIVPGIILACGLSMVPYILKDNPYMSAYDALKRSWQMTKGHKKEVFLLLLSFIGWLLLVILTLGVAAIWMMPYMMTSHAALYKELKEHN